ncbi:WD repeat-containing protein 26 homolog isoform X1 [Vicia villosa]|uniref:WD repeat-containing protein 26 homolog isoform X1 n=2 Tax=Vicia villosa TaxID=3911 RepID=UPI00273C9401|nr:WD repeat-containing protein 26 homolog isoform X1 [Vicia villosa]XP_058762025.1 WD repeat-containing protein 26 homolog isoform X1 [Vicia villosa]XP_058762026.1 WD repeat-containing protein 26 homolog isoform X1 [Vicia villosa]XP_058788278.1 WD repeat-containing protein 26 homolog isoform X1 [Vicia villosa]XP_058788279.1 WD repeat-containing protein 26 homolog isoform X1 [Vicia villosa]XP_058788280.1 WD repeat-containing protein 26 homolog isoform X1 [Vicia villosa]XP_058788281.1 WD repea
MGGVEDEEPALKRTKLSAKGFFSLSNCSSSVECVVGSSSGSMARPLSNEGDDKVVGSKGIINREEFVRIITKALYSLGYEKSGENLEEESGIRLNSSVVNLFKQQIHDGDWEESVATLKEIGLEDESIVRDASFLILEQKFFELLNGDKVMDALNTLRTEITQICVDSTRIRELSSCIVSPYGQDGSSIQDFIRARTRLKLLEKLQKLIPPTVMIPEKRLEHLVEQAIILQREACSFHNILDKEMSLYSDHHCGKTQIPSRTLQILDAHNDEVWFVQFSHDGKYLATASKDRTAIIWEVATDGGLSMKHRLIGHQNPVSSVSWSPNGQELLTCGEEEAVRRWDVITGECLQVYEKNGSGFISCAWFPCGKYVLSGLSDKSICMWELDGTEVECWTGQKTLKISDLEITGDGEHLLSICKENTIMFFNKETKHERFIEEDQVITSFSLSKDSRFLLVSLLNQEIHLWNIEGDPKLVSKYKSHKRSRFIIRSCFGGHEQSFIASGSEDSQVYIWHRSSGDLVDALPGHSGAVNCVSWNPANPHMLASASDDRTVRIWGLKRLDVKCPNAYSNGNNHHCNGGKT